MEEEDEREREGGRRNKEEDDLQCVFVRGDPDARNIPASL